MLSNNFDLYFKIVIIGDSKVGKTSVLQRYVENSFRFSHLSTIGVDLLMKTLTYENKTIKLHLWDTAGQERFRSMASSYYKGCDAVIFAYDISSLISFNKAKIWITEFIENNDNNLTQNTTNDHDNVIKVLIGNKSDLEKKRKVSYYMGEMIAKQFQIEFFETSALNNTGISQMFDVLVKQLYEKDNKYNNENSVPSISINNKVNISNKRCCN